MGFGAGIKKSASRIKHLLQMAGLASQRICISCYTHVNSEEPYDLLNADCIELFWGGFLGQSKKDLLFPNYSPFMK
jgi:hypothetical protein